MGEFYINTETITRQSTRLMEVSDTVKDIQRKVSEVKSGLAVIGLGQVAPTIIALESRLSRHVEKTNSLSTVLGKVMLKYIMAESDIMGVPFFLNPDFKVIAGTVMDNTLDALEDFGMPFFNLLTGNKKSGFFYEEEVESVLLPFLEHNTYKWGDFKIDFGNGNLIIGEREIGLGIKYDSYELELINLECHDEESKKNWVDRFRKEYNFDDELHRDYDENYSRANTNPSLKNEAAVSVSMLSADEEFNVQYGSLKGDVSALNAEAHALSYFGLFSDDGKFAPGAGLEIGASASILETSGEARLGNDYLGIYAKGQAEIGKVAAAATVDFGIYDEEGNFKPSIGAGVEAEAIAGQIGGSVGRRVLGTDIGVSGNIGFGVGAHANIGFQDGKLSFDAGAYIGVGGGVSFELDLNDTYDTIVSAYDTASEWVGEKVDDISDWASDVADAASDFAGDVADAASDFAGEAWDFITFWD